MAYNVKEEYDRVKISKEEADRIMKKAYNKRRDMLITPCIIIGLIVIFLIVIFGMLRNHAANSLYDRIYNFETAKSTYYYPENGTDTFTVNGEEYEFDLMRSHFKFYSDNTVEWTMSFDTDLSGDTKYTDPITKKYSFEIKSDVFEGEPYVMLENGIKLTVICDDVIGQPILDVKYLGE